MKPATLLLMLLCAVGLCAQDGLYAPSVPDDAALVRVVNATQTSVTVDLGPRRFSNVERYAASPYRAIDPGIFIVNYAGGRHVIEPAARSFTTLVFHPAGIAVFPDERHTDAARSQVVVYNITTGPIDLRAIEPEATLASAVAPLGSGMRVVNAIPVEIGAFVDDAPTFRTRLSLERGASYGLFVVEEGGSIEGFVVKAALAAE